MKYKDWLVNAGGSDCERRSSGSASILRGRTVLNGIIGAGKKRILRFLPAPFACSSFFDKGRCVLQNRRQIRDVIRFDFPVSAALRSAAFVCAKTHRVFPEYYGCGI